MSTHIIIPARLASSRLPNKVLAEVGGVPMVVRSYQQAQQAQADTVLVAADDPAVVAACEAHGVPVCLTDPAHPSGTSRLSEVVTQQAWPESDVVVCWQADEPLLPPGVVTDLMAQFSAQSHAPMASVYDEITDPADLVNPSVVKVVLNAEQEALYFSRAPVPWHRDAFAQGVGVTCPAAYYRHIGLYAYEVGFLKRYVTWSPSPLEQIESLEQLRVLYYGESIAMVRASASVPAGVDTPADLAAVRNRLS